MHSVTPENISDWKKLSEEYHKKLNKIHEKAEAKPFTPERPWNASSNMNKTFTNKYDEYKIVVSKEAPTTPAQGIKPGNT